MWVHAIACESAEEPSYGSGREKFIVMWISYRLPLSYVEVLTKYLKSEEDSQLIDKLNIKIIIY